jgi:glutamate dehydrogenase
MLLQITHLARRATRWLLRHRRHALDVADLTAHFAPNIGRLADSGLALLGASGAARCQAQIKRWQAGGVTAAVAQVCANAASLVATLPIIDAAERRAADPLRVGSMFAALNAALGIDWLADQLARLTPASLWQAMERDLLLDDLLTDHGELAAIIHTHAPTDGAVDGDAAAVNAWLAGHTQFARAWRVTLESAQRTSGADFSMLSMTCRKLHDLISTADIRE